MKSDIIKKANVNLVYRKNGKIFAHVDKKLPLSELREEDIIPSFVDGLKTDVIESEMATFDNTQKYRPVFGGISCADSNLGGGTLGVIVRDTINRSLVGLICNHTGGVLYDPNYDIPTYGNTALSHINIIQPSTNDGGTITGDTLGAPIRAIPTQFGEGGSNIVDASIFEIPVNLPKTDIQNISIGPFPIITSKGDYTTGTVIRKNGRTTDLQEGTIIDTDVDVVVGFYDSVAYYTGQIMSDISSEPGDSGSVIVTRELGEWKLVGLHMASTTEYSFANHMIDIAELLEIEAWDGSVVIDGEYDYIMVNGRCYKYKGTTLNVISHNLQREYNSCAACKGGTYPQIVKVMN